MPRLAAFMLLPLLAAGLARAEIYQWTDENGRVHFGDSPAGAGQKARPVPPPRVTSPSGGTGKAAAPAADSDAAARRQRLERLQAANEADRQAAEEREREKEREKARKEGLARHCQQLRNELASMEGRPVYLTGEDGERQFLDDAQRKDYVDKANQVLQEHCQ